MGGVPELVEDGVTGFLVPPKDPDALAGALQKLIADPELRRRMGEAGRKKASKSLPSIACSGKSSGLGWFLLCELCSQINSHFVSGSWQRESRGAEYKHFDLEAAGACCFCGCFYLFSGVMPCS